MRKQTLLLCTIFVLASWEPLSSADSFVEKIWENDIEGVHLDLRDNGVSPHGEPGGLVPLVEAARLGHIELMRWLLLYGADINQRANFSDDGLLGSALFEAARNLHVEAVGKLLEWGADLMPTIYNSRRCSHGVWLRFIEVGYSLGYLLDKMPWSEELDMIMALLNAEYERRHWDCIFY